MKTLPFLFLLACGSDASVTVSLPGYATRLQWGGSCKVADIPCSFHTGKVDCARDEVCVAKRKADCGYEKPRCIPRERPAGGVVPSPAVVVTP